MTEYRKPRPEVIHILANSAMESMESSGIDNLGVSEVVSAAFTLVTRICKTVIDESPKEDFDSNVEIITTAIGQLYAILPGRTIH